MSEAIRFSHVYFSYEQNKDVVEASKCTINDVSFTINKGEYVALIGHNGSGKSTIAKIIVGILEAFTDGNENDGVYIDGIKMTENNYQSLQKKIGMVFQNPDNQFIGSTVQDDIAFSLENVAMPYDQMKVLVEEYSKKVGMYEYLSREPSSLSGGQKQRVAIAGTLVRHPEILVLDEATSMLDPQGRNDIRTLIRNMKKENPDLTIISITHDIEEAYQSDHVIVINKGKVVKEGTPDDVFSDEVLMKKIDLTIPFYKQLKNELEKYGIDINGVDNIDELVDRLCR
ncbi:cobalt ABC superfamily ATP binding cassette transporter ABC protein [Firmicutes bacterium CAG:345]|jgi:hypothetical protein|nr:cobalt ABC superfamily ATP binding cassette transporter ABC protein [Firmicutes bacterium CAG:345]